MALVTRYVNTASTAGGDGTTNATSGANRAYASLTEWEAAEQTNLVSAGDYHKVICSGGVLADNFIIAGWTTAENNFVWVTVDEASRHNGTPQSGFYLSTSAGFTSICYINQTWTIVEYLDVENTSPSGRGFDISGTSSTELIVNKCIAKAPITGFNFLNTGTTVNCLAYDCSTGFSGANWSPSYAYNCTAGNCTTGFTRGGTNGAVKFLLKNCVAYGCTTDYLTPLSNYFDTTNSTNNATDDTVTTDVPGSNPLANIVSGDFTNIATEDWSLASGSNLAEAGADLTTDFGGYDRTNYTLAEEDIIDTTRPQSTNWDIGAFELVSGGGGGDSVRTGRGIIGRGITR